MVVHKQLKRLAVHTVHRFPQEQGAAVRSHVMQPGHGKYGHQLIHILLADQFKQILWLGPGGKCHRVDQPRLNIPGHADIPPSKPLVEKAAVGNDIGRKHQSPRLRHTDGLPQGPPLILRVIKVVQRPQQQHDVVRIVRERGQIHGISLGNCDRLAGPRILPENLYIVLHQLHGVHGIPPARQGVRIPAGSGPHLQHAVSGPYILLNVAHGGEKLNRTVPGRQAAVLVVLVVKIN